MFACSNSFCEPLWRRHTSPSFNAPRNLFDHRMSVNRSRQGGFLHPFRVAKIDADAGRFICSPNAYGHDAVYLHPISTHAGNRLFDRGSIGHRLSVCAGARETQCH